MSPYGGLHEIDQKDRAVGLTRAQAGQRFQYLQTGKVCH
jgi:hypothetical protein